MSPRSDTSPPRFVWPLRRVFARASFLKNGPATSSATGIPSSSQGKLRATPELSEPAQFSEWEDALRHYHRSTGVDLCDQSQDLYRKLVDCSGYGAIVDILVKTAEDFHQYRHPSSGSLPVKFRRLLKPIIRTLIGSGVLDIGGEVAASAPVPGGKAIIVAIGVLIKATQGVSEHFDTIETLLERFEFCLRRLEARGDVPLEPASQVLAVKILVEMLHTLAIVTQAMRETRLRHFASVLLGKSNTIMDTSRRLESLEMQDTRLTLDSVYREIYSLSRSLHDVLEETLTPLRDQLDTISIRIAELSVHTRSNAATMTNLQSTAIAMSSPTHSHAAGLRGPESSNALTIQHSGQAVGTVEIWRVCLAITYNNAIASTRTLSSNILSALNELPAHDRHNLNKGLNMISTVAAFVAGVNVKRVTSAVGSRHGVFASVFLSMAMTTVATYFYRKYLPRDLGQPPSSTILIIDILGGHAVVPLDKYSSWQDLHGLLLHRFTDKPGVEYVSSRSYAITDTVRESTIITPETWGTFVQPGMTLEMSVVIRQSSLCLCCPYCNITDIRPVDCEFIHCWSCTRPYRISSATEFIDGDGSSHDDRFPSPREPSYDATTPDWAPSSDFNLDSGVASGERENVDDSESMHNTDSQPTMDMSLFRRIMVEIASNMAFADNDTPFTGGMPSTETLLSTSVYGVQSDRWQLNDDVDDFVYTPPGPTPIFIFPSPRDLEGVGRDGAIDPAIASAAHDQIARMKATFEPHLMEDLKYVDPPIEVDEWAILLERGALMTSEIERRFPTFIVYTRDPNAPSKLELIHSKCVSRIMTFELQRKLATQHPPRFIIDLNMLRGFIQNWSNLLTMMRNRSAAVRLEFQAMHDAKASPIFSQHREDTYATAAT
ncbi:unnamed protein product [Peniophora sp. CBMAI 1063]|nr:unnamed protein product [Peniophora sp. CBMAI 1063]